ncbi:Multidrug resistance efflux pump-like protein [Thioalkalivibrio nitratireducens DSM 14787]|uniref:Multidrug resistance efflux pump-like protein n=1 Tax=Thioalkalivibrio nitratireducens (strain DSM 14787 / UNIQEM 213 / ALEN2) TaxID=1255043 RepID=L0DUY9_THIND|nr:efflux RND transporter periplasmic adaptor subunit [Thioalkalivibrio nitratireducens]AGA32181.1 Multidrug resistance efflux pump-like protein [Thioalkalivibrio nitratireducens DSM 14787]
MGNCRPLLLAAGLLGAGIVSAIASAAAEELPARIDWGQRYTVSSPVAGVVREIAVQPGDRVEAAQLLFSLDTRRLQADARAAEAERERLRLELAEADREVERAEELYDRTLIAVRELELARIERSMAAASLARTEAQLQKTRVDIGDSRIEAPAAGRILSVTVTIGEAVSPALAPPVLATLGTTDPMRAVTTVDADTAAGLEPGQPARIDIGGERFSGTVGAVGWEPEDVGFGTGYRVDVHFSPPDSLRLRAGQSGKVRIGNAE